MPDGGNYEDSIFSEFEDLKRRIHNLETAQRMPNASQTGGNFRLLSPTTGLELRREGTINFFPGGDESLPPTQSFYGFAFYDGSHNSVLIAGDGKQGLVKPCVPMAFVSSSPATVTSGSFTRLFSFEMDRLFHDTLVIEGSITTDAATTAEIVIREFTSGLQTAVLSVPVSTDASYSFVWLHPFGVSSNGQFTSLEIMCRRVSGAGDCFLYPPRHAEMVSSRRFTAAAVDGAPVLF